MRVWESRRWARRSAVLGVAVIALAGPQAAFGLSASTPSGGIVDTRQPLFTWTGLLTSPPGTTYEVTVVTDNIGVVATAPLTDASAASAIPLPDDRPITWYVRARRPGRSDVVTGRRTFTVATIPAPPAVVAGPAPAVSTRTPTFSWAGTRLTSSWTLSDAAGAVVQAGAAPSASGQVTLASLADGAYTFDVRQRGLQPVDGQPATVPFTVDTAAPAMVGVALSRSSTTRSPQASFDGLEPGASATWRVIGVGGSVLLGPAGPTRGPVQVDALPAGAYVFEARQTDAAGNAGAWAARPFAVDPEPPAPVQRVSAAGGRLPRLNAGRLRPAAGRTISTRRPLLSWKRQPGHAIPRLYNVQVFRVARTGTALTKVFSSFPRGKRLRIPRRAALTPGACYVWRVWPYSGRRYTKNPLGVSHFCVRRRA